KSGFSLSEARVLFELATRVAGGATEIAGDLGLDPGYLSRILRKLDDDGLLARSPSPTDARHSILRLTRKGRNVFGELNRRSSGQAREILNKLTPGNRSLLIRSMHDIEAILEAKEQNSSAFVLR